MSMLNYCSVPGGGGELPYIGYIGMVYDTVKGMVFKQFILA